LPVNQWKSARTTNAIERLHVLRAVKARLHQASFQDAVLTIYGGRCAILHLLELGCSTPPEQT
jgi:hypothetical protein